MKKEWSDLDIIVNRLFVRNIHKIDDEYNNVATFIA